jgi:hypothetical protein
MQARKGAKSSGGRAQVRRRAMSSTKQRRARVRRAAQEQGLNARNLNITTMIIFRREATTSIFCKCAI